MTLNDDLEKLATEAVNDWPEISFSGQFNAAIRDLYRTHLSFRGYRHDTAGHPIRRRHRHRDRRLRPTVRLPAAS